MPPRPPYSDTTSVNTDFGLGSEELWTQMPKEWDIHDDSYAYAPPKPEGDPWDKILAPLLEKDNIKCSAWKEEVQNLLIFAGLFSAVVTAFIIESYKLLQAPSSTFDSTMILARLLYDQRDVHSTIPITPTMFQPSSSAIRINTFWFISLMLSLATVLVGIISMQWIREHQSYPNLSARETLALFNMRSEAFDKWHVEAIFAALPLLLQAALVLFFGGIIDFLSQLHREVAITVTVVIAIILLFLVATTLLPTLQCLALYASTEIIGSYSKPSQCPYKSPQSWTFHSLHNSIGLLLAVFGKALARIFCMIHLQHPVLHSGSNHVFPHLKAAMGKKNWIDFDLAWLSVRDACVHGSKKFDPYLSLNECRVNMDSSLPLYDISQVLNNAIGDDVRVKHSESWLSVVYYCYHDIATSFLTHDAYRKGSYSDEGLDNIQRCFRYLSQLLNIEDPGYDLVIQYEGTRYDNIRKNLSESAQATLYNRNLYGFLSQARYHFAANPNLSNHMLEIKFRLMKTFYSPYANHDYHIRPTRLPSHLPTSLMFYPYEVRRLRDKNHTKQKQLSVFYWQYYHILLDYFKSVAYSKRSQFPQNSLHDHRDIVDFLESASQHTYSACSSDSVLHIASHNRRNIWNAYEEILHFLIMAFRDDWTKMKAARRKDKTLRRSANDSDDSFKFEPGSIDLFYTSAIYVQHFLSIMHEKQSTSSIDSSLNILCQVMRRYRAELLDIGSLPNTRLEDQFKGTSGTSSTHRFSIEWWSFLDKAPQSTSPTSSDDQKADHPPHQPFLVVEVERHLILDANSESGGLADRSNSESSVDMASEYDTSNVLGSLGIADHENQFQGGKPSSSMNEESEKAQHTRSLVDDRPETLENGGIRNATELFHPRPMTISSVPPIVISSPRSSSVPLVTHEPERDSDDNATVRLSTSWMSEQLQSSTLRVLDADRLHIPILRRNSVPRMRKNARPPI